MTVADGGACEVLTVRLPQVPGRDFCSAVVERDFIAAEIASRFALLEERK